MIEQGVHVVVGSLGDGKTLRSVQIAEEFLQNNLRVATNINLRIERLTTREQRTSLVTRIPDKPTIRVLKDLGEGSKKKGEYGLLLLDELGIWMNSRTYADKDRLPIIRFIIEARKRRWIPVFIAQKASLIDKQVRDIGATIHRCRNTKNIFWLKWLPPIHFVTMVNTLRTKAGSSEFYRNRHLFNSYDTEQQFNSDYDIDFGAIGGKQKEFTRKERHYKRLNGYYSYLPIQHLPSSYVERAEREQRKSKLRDTLQSGALMASLLTLVIFAGSTLFNYGASSLERLDSLGESSPSVEGISTISEYSEYPTRTTQITNPVSLPTVLKKNPIPDMRIIGHSRIGSKSNYIFQIGDTQVTQSQLEASGLNIRDRGKNEALITNSDYEFRSIFR